jgi:hypothetical protein
MIERIPSADALPVVPWIFHGLEDLLFFIHILLVDTILGLCLAALASRLRRGTGALEGFVGQPVRVAPVFFALTVTLGVAPLLFTQVLYGQFFYASSVLMAVFWILVVPLIIVGYYALYIRARSQRPTSALATAAIALTACVLLYIAFMFVSNVTLMLNPGDWAAYAANRGGTSLPLSDRGLPPRFLHFAVGAFAVGGLSMAALNRIRLRGAERAAAERLGLRIFGFATIVECVVGCWFLFSLPRDFAAGFSGGQAWPTLVLCVGMVAGAAAVVTALIGRFLPTVVLAPVSVLGMVLARDALRTMYLKPYLADPTIAANPQYGVLALFLAVLAVGAAAVAWMVRAGFRMSRTEARP